MYISPVYTLDQVSHVYEGLFGELRNEDYWPAYTSQILCPSPDMKRTSTGRPKSSRIRTEMDMREQQWSIQKMFILSNTRTYKKNMPQHCWSIQFSPLIMFRLTQSIPCTIN